MYKSSTEMVASLSEAINRATAHAFTLPVDNYLTSWY